MYIYHLSTSPLLGIFASYSKRIVGCLRSYLFYSCHTPNSMTWRGGRMPENNQEKITMVKD